MKNISLHTLTNFLTMVYFDVQRSHIKKITYVSSFSDFVQAILTFKVCSSHMVNITFSLFFSVPDQVEYK